MAGKDKGLVVDQRLLKVSTYQEVVRGGVGVGVVGGVFCLWRQAPSSRIFLCNYTPQKTFIPLFFTEREMKDKRDRGM